MKFYMFGQNNSGGSFDHDAKAGVGYKICIQAESAEAASAKFDRIRDSYNEGGDCPCCGPRWSDWIDESDGMDYPASYSYENAPPLEGGWGIPSYIHYANGKIQAVGEAR